MKGGKKQRLTKSQFNCCFSKERRRIKAVYFGLEKQTCIVFVLNYFQQYFLYSNLRPHSIFRSYYGNSASFVPYFHFLSSKIVSLIGRFFYLKKTSSKIVIYFSSFSSEGIVVEEKVITLRLRNCPVCAAEYPFTVWNWKNTFSRLLNYFFTNGTIIENLKFFFLIFYNPFGLIGAQ